MKIENNPASTITTGGGVVIGGYAQYTNSHPPETLFELNPRPYGIKVEKVRNPVLGEDQIVLRLENLNGSYRGEFLVDLLLDLKAAVDTINADDDEEDDIEDDDLEEEEDEDLDESDVPPPPSRANEQADGASFCNCPMCVAGRVR